MSKEPNTFKIYQGDNREVLKTLPDNSVDAIVTDPPYELGFMGKGWDKSGIANDVTLWRECLRVLKPGGHLLAFSGSRTYHRMTCAIEDAGFEVRDQMMWVYGSGFPKSLNVGKKIEGWDGWGTALKPAHEPICLAKKPLDGTVADNVLKWGVGALNIDASRVGTEGKDKEKHLKEWNRIQSNQQNLFKGLKNNELNNYAKEGRWPANLIHDGSDEVVELFPNESARFFYCPKASKHDRDEGLEGFEEKRESDHIKDDGVGGDNPRNRTNKPRRNTHPTVKPTELMQYLCRLVTPSNGTVLDLFTGSGSTGKAAVLEGFNFIGCELSADYIAIAQARIAHALNKTTDETKAH